MSIFDALSNRRQFILYRLVPRPDGKTDKIPTDPLTGANSDAQDPTTWMLPTEARAAASLWGEGYGVGIVIYEGCGLFCIDLDSCRDGAGWLPHVPALEGRFPGAYTETSVSLKGRHILGSYTGAAPEHGTRNKTFRMEAYTARRFIALADIDASGSVLKDCTTQLAAFLEQYFPARPEAEHGVEWTTEPVASWRGPADDTELVHRACRSQSARAVFGAGAAFKDLWTGNADILAKVFPANSAVDAWDRSAGDLALANHLAFWTGNNCERMERIMRACEAQQRPKWGRDDYIRGTILRACASQTEWYTEAAPAGLQAVQEPAANKPTSTAGAPIPTPPPADAPVSAPASGIPIPAPLATHRQFEPGQRPPVGEYVSNDEQAQIFAGMCYVKDVHAIQMTDGSVSKKEQFDAWFGGPLWGMTPDGQKPSKSAWDVFLNNEVNPFRRVTTQYFNPLEPTGTIRQRNGREEVNCYYPLLIPGTYGDPGPFLDLVRRILPNGTDAEILIAYMAAVTQYAGTKFKWAPFLQGVKGNGKTTIAKVLQYCVGQRYTHWAKADQLGEKFNSVFVQQLLVIVDEMQSDDIYQLQEILKQFITADRIEVRPMFGEKTMKDICFNMLLISNHKNGVRIDGNERRFAPLFCAQQEKEHLARDGLTEDYFIALFDWLKGDGYAIVYKYLSTYAIPDALNPATRCIRAPETTSTKEAATKTLGNVEQEIIEAVEQQQDGFRNGWISAGAVDMLLARVGKAKNVPRGMRRDIIQTLGFIPHPSLQDGMCSVALPDGTFPRLYIAKGHAWAVAHLTPQQVRDGFLEAQRIR